MTKCSVCAKDVFEPCYDREVHDLFYRGMPLVVCQNAPPDTLTLLTVTARLQEEGEDFEEASNYWGE